MNLQTSIAILWFLLLGFVFVSATVARKIRHRNAVVVWYSRYWWVVLFILTAVYLLPVFILTPPDTKYTLTKINGIAYVRWDSVQRDMRPTNHDKKIEEQQRKIKELEEQQKQMKTEKQQIQNEKEELQNKINAEKDQTDDVIINLNKEISAKEKEIEELLLNITSLQSKNEELWDELLLEQDACIEGDTRQECINYFKRKIEKKEQEENQQRESTKYFFVSLSVAVLLVIILIIYYESGLAFKVFELMFTVHMTNDSESMVKTIFKNDYYIFQCLTAGMWVMVYIIVIIFSKNIIGALVLLITCGLEMCYIFILYNVRTFSMDCINNVKNRRKYKIKKKGEIIIEIKNMKIMPANFCYGYGYQFAEFINVFHSPNIDLEEAVKLIEEYGINEMSRIADVYVPMLVGVNPLQWGRINQPVDGTASIATIDAYFGHIIEGINYQNNVVNQFKVLCELTSQFKRRVEERMSDRDVVILFILMLVFDYRIREAGARFTGRGNYIKAEDNLSKIIMEGKRKIDRFDKFDIGSEKYLQVKHFEYCDGVKVYLQSIDSHNATIQFYSVKSMNIKMIPSLIRGKMLVMSEKPEELVGTLKSITNELEYEIVNNSTKHHPDSHYLSKVYHNRNINNLIDVIHGTEVLDVGTNFCDIKLGNGVIYNLSMEEEKDTNRIQHYLNRVTTYMKNNSGSLTILFGDVTTMDLRNTRIKKIYMQNCVYNIDLAQMMRMCEHNKVDSCVTMNQCTRGVFDMMECENKTNEMTYTFVEHGNESTLSRSNVKLIAITEGSRYEHNVSTMFDWFLINSLKIGENVYWNKNIDELKHGYYLQTWYRAGVKVMDNDAIMNNEETIDCISVKDTADYISVVFTSRYKRSNVRDQIFLNKDVKNKRDFNVMMMMRNSLLEDAEINLIMSDSLSEIACKKNTNQLYYRLVRSAIKQQQVEIELQVVDNEKVYERGNLIKYEFDLNAVTQMIIANDYNAFINKIHDYGEKGIQTVLHFKDTLYYIKNVNYNTYRNVYVSLGKDEVNTVEFTAIKKKLEIESRTFYNMWKIHLIKLNQITEYSIKGKTLREVADKIDVGEMCVMDQLECTHEIEDTSNVGVNVKVKNYRIPENYMFTNIDALEHAKVTGKIKTKQVVSMSVLDMDHKLYYSPFNKIFYDNVRNAFRINDRNYQLCVMIEAIEMYNRQAQQNGLPQAPVPAYVNNNVNEATVPIFMRKLKGRCSKMDVNDIASQDVLIPEDMQKELLCIIVGGEKYYTDIMFLNQLECEGYQSSESLMDLMF